MSLPPHPIVERWFVELAVKQIRRGVHCSTGELVDAIPHYLAVTNETASRKTRCCNGWGRIAAKPWRPVPWSKPWSASSGLDQNFLNENDFLAGRQGFEPRYRGPEPRVLPLDDLPVQSARCDRWELSIIAQQPALGRPLEGPIESTTIYGRLSVPIICSGFELATVCSSLV